MTNQSTIDKLIEMRLTTMADAFRNQLDDTKFKDVPFEDRFGMLVDIEYSNRSITHIMTLTIANVSDQALRLAQFLADNLHDFNVLLLVVTADVVDFTNTTLVDNQILYPGGRFLQSL